MEYLALIHTNAGTAPTSAEWDRFIKAAVETGLFRGGSAIGVRRTVGTPGVADTSQQVGGFMRFDAEEPSELLRLLESHPVVVRGGTVELFEMPKS
jgi:hypothetical protein